MAWTGPDTEITQETEGRTADYGRVLMVRPQRQDAKKQGPEKNGHGRTPEAQLAEACGLAEAIALDVADAILVPIRKAKAATLFGEGQVARLGEQARELGCGLIIIDGVLSPLQQRNLERATHTKVIDRTGLVLEIFGARAHTREGVLQVELAHLTYQQSRLVRSWTHLERQRGGHGFLGGPGETQIELDRRMIRARIDKLKIELEEVRRTRALHRRQRERSGLPAVALVGYTNAGKSTLFNSLSGAEVMAEDLLFATLDPTVRALEVGGGQRAGLLDTVGFIANLPTHLVAAFRATLEEVTEADIIVHVRDIAHADSESQALDVRATLASLGLTLDAGEKPTLIEVWNKADLLDEEDRAALTLRAERHKAVLISAQTGEGLETLREVIRTILAGTRQDLTLILSPKEGALRAWLHRHADILDEQVDDEGGLHLHVRITTERLADWKRLHRATP